MNHVIPCKEWADKLVTSHPDTLSPSDYLILKEHLLSCPDCMAAHRNYLAVEAQIRSLPVLQPQRQFSPKLLWDAEMQQRILRPQQTPIRPRIQIMRKRIAAFIAIYVTPLQNLLEALRKPWYALVTLLFCLLTTVAGISTVSQLSHSNTTPRILQQPHLTVTTPNITLTIAEIQPSSISTAPTSTNPTPLTAYGTLILRNTGTQPLKWHFDSEKSVFVYMLSPIQFSSQPSYGTLQHNQRTPIQVIASNIFYALPSPNHTITLGNIVFTSNEGDLSVPTLLKTTPEFTPTKSSLPQPLFLTMGMRTMPFKDQFF